MLAALEAAFIYYPHAQQVTLNGLIIQLRELTIAGITRFDEPEAPYVQRDMFWQQARIWLSNPTRPPFPLHYIVTQGLRHPCRAPKPAGPVYMRAISWLNATLSFRAIDPDIDIDHFHQWMNDPSVAAFWQEEGDKTKHRAYIETIASDPHALGLIGCFDDEPFGYFEIYWAKEDRIAPFCEAGDFDRGWHVLIGEHRFRGKPYVTAWLPSISHYLFLDDCRTQRIVIEPRSDNTKMIGNLTKCGYAMLKEFDFPHKRAMLGVLLRERFFGEGLWVPKPSLTAPSF
jgi:RimJ/RimL family protein N-acetyltransferase